MLPFVPRMSTPISGGGIKDHVKLGPFGRDNRLGKLKIISLFLGSFALAFHVAVFGIIELKSVTVWASATSTPTLELETVDGTMETAAVSSEPKFTFEVFLEEMKDAITAGDSRMFAYLGAVSFSISLGLVVSAWLFSAQQVAVALSTSLWSCGGFLDFLSRREAWGHAKALSVATFIDVYFGAGIYYVTDTFLGSALVLLLAVAAACTLGQAVACYRIGSLEKKEMAMMKPENSFYVTM